MLLKVLAADAILSTIFYFVIFSLWFKFSPTEQPSTIRCLTHRVNAIQDGGAKQAPLPVFPL